MTYKNTHLLFELSIVGTAYIHESIISADSVDSFKNGRWYSYGSVRRQIGLIAIRTALHWNNIHQRAKTVCTLENTQN